VIGSAGDRAERRKRRLAKIGRQIIPAPPGITYWRQITTYWRQITVSTPFAGAAFL
jgi:hypothetical protein